jgi:hypothetical protein
VSIKATVAKFAAKQVLLVQREAPTILFVAGIASIGTSTVLACKATMQLQGKVDLLERGHTAIETRAKIDKDFSERDRRTELLSLKMSFMGDVAKLYAPAFIFAAIGVASLSGSHYLLNRRNAAITAAYAGLMETHREYRRRVAQEVGEDRERELHYEAQNNALHERNKDGTVSKSRRKNPMESSIYARFFDQTNLNWQPVPEYNKVFLHGQQQYQNNRLQTRGYVFLNEVYRDLGIEPTKAGQAVGWILSDDGTTDNYIDFGIFDGGTRELRAFVNGEEGSILLDFNVDGNIMNRVRMQER